MDVYKERIIEVENHFVQNDLSLAYRRLIDLILDAENISFYQKIISYSIYSITKTNRMKKRNQKD